MLRRLNHLDRREIARADTDISWQRHLREADGARVWVIGRAGDLEGRDDRVAHVLGNGAESHVDVDQGGLMALEPARLEGHGAAADRPFAAVLRCGHAAA